LRRGPFAATANPWILLPALDASAILPITACRRKNAADVKAAELMLKLETIGGN